MHYVLEKRSDLLKEEPKEGDPVPCILDQLCAHHDGIPNEVKSIRNLIFCFIMERNASCLLLLPWCIAYWKRSLIYFLGIYIYILLTERERVL